MPDDVLLPLEGKRVWVAGHRGMVVSATLRRRASERCEVIRAGRDIKPDRTPRVLMSAARLRSMGWSPRVELRAGIADAWAGFEAANPTG